MRREDRAVLEFELKNAAQKKPRPGADALQAAAVAVARVQ
jgi:hypothetical protein